MFKNYFKTAYRILTRNKVYSFINIVGLSIGLACAMLIVLYVKDELSFDRFHTKSAQLFRIDRKIERPNGSTDNSGYTGYFQGPRFSANIPEIETFVRLQPSNVDIKKGNDIQSEPVYYADASFFSAFSFPLLK